MFSGIVDHCGQISAINITNNAMRVEIQTSFSDVVLGESICVDGVCLTVCNFQQGMLEFDISPETLSKTVAGDYQVNQKVNLERSMKMNDRVSGHFVTGHVDNTIVVSKCEQHEQYVLFAFTGLSPGAQQYLVSKGSVCLNGVSLTINRVTEDGFEIMLIPHTLSLTNLQSLTAGSRVNVEYDYLAKIVAKQTQLQMEATE